MKLNTKFVILISSFVIVTMGVSFSIFASFSKIRQTQQFEQQTLQMELLIQKIYAFPPTILAIRANTDTIISEWQELSKKANEQMTIISAEKYKMLLSKEEAEDLDKLLKVWNVIIPQLEKVEVSLKEFIELEFSETEILSLDASGAIKTTNSLDDSDSRKTLMSYMINRIIQATTVLMQTNDTFSKVLGHLTTSLTERNQKMFNTFIIQNILILLITSIAVFIIALKVTRKITNRVKVLQNASIKLAEKDFTVDISNITKDKDEISFLAATLSNTIKDLSSFFEVVKDSSLQNVTLGDNISLAAHTTASATHEIRSNIESLRKQFDNIEKAVENSVDSLTRMSTAVMGLAKDNNIQSIAIQESDKASSKMAISVEKIRNMAEENCSSAEEMQEAVAYGDQKIGASNSMIREVATQIKIVTEIVDVINTVAEQTNILAMNAAIESAHAGESGKGFAVVAEEIRTLAESTGENSKRISDSLFTITSRMNEVTDFSESAAQAFADINEKSSVIHTSLNTILENISEAAGEAEKVASFSQRITSASEEMNVAYDNLNAQRQAVSAEMEKLENVVALSRNGIDEIKNGAEDIVDRMLSVNEMSTESRTKMTSLSNDLNQFKTNINNFVNISAPIYNYEISNKELEKDFFHNKKQNIEETTTIEETPENPENLETLPDIDTTNSEHELQNNNSLETESSHEAESLQNDFQDKEESFIAESFTEEPSTNENTAEDEKHGLLSVSSIYLQNEKEINADAPLDDFDSIFN